MHREGYSTSDMDIKGPLSPDMPPYSTQNFVQMFFFLICRNAPAFYYLIFLKFLRILVVQNLQKYFVLLLNEMHNVVIALSEWKETSSVAGLRNVSENFGAEIVIKK